MAVFFKKEHDGIRTFFVEPGQVIDSMDIIEIQIPTQSMLMTMTKASMIDLLHNLGLRITNASKLTKDRIANRIIEDFSILTSKAQGKSKPIIKHMDKDKVIDAWGELIADMWCDEKNHWEETGKPADHHFMNLKVIDKFIMGFEVFIG